MTHEEANGYTILRAVVGSRGLGLETPESDIDEMGVVIEPLHEAVGLSAPFEQFVRTGPEKTREGPDLQLYGLRKFLRLALSGNPTIVTLLFVPSQFIVKLDARGAQLMDLAPQIISKQAGKAFLGYMQAQRQRLTGQRGQKRCTRPELVAAHGYDTKYAMHILRLGMQGVELLETGRLALPMLPLKQDMLLQVRSGGFPLQDVLTMAGELEAKLKDLMDSPSALQERPDSAAVEAWMLRSYLNTWKAMEPPLFAKSPYLDGV